MRDHYGGRRQQARLGHDDRFHVIGNQGHSVNVNAQGFNVEEDQSASKMTHKKSHADGDFDGAARWNGDCFTASGRVGEFTRASGSSHRWNHESYNPKPPLYRRTSPNVDSSSYSPRQRGYGEWRAGQRDVRRYAPYVKQRPAYTAPRPIISPASPSYHPSFEQQTYVPSNPSILPMTTQDNHFSSPYKYEAASYYPRQAQQHYHSPTSPPDYSPVSPLYQSGILKPTAGRPPSRVDEATKAKLRRKLAVTLLTEKYKTTMAKEHEKRRIEYDPSAPTYKQDSTQSRLEYDPASPEY